MAAISRNQSDLMNNSILKRVWPRQGGGGALPSKWAFWKRACYLCVCVCVYVCVKVREARGEACHTRLHPQTGCRLDYWGEERGGEVGEEERRRWGRNGGREEKDGGERRKRNRDSGRLRREESFNTSALGGVRMLEPSWDINADYRLQHAQSRIHSRTVYHFQMNWDSSVKLNYDLKDYHRFEPCWKR